MIHQHHLERQDKPNKKVRQLLLDKAANTFLMYSNVSLTFSTSKRWNSTSLGNIAVSGRSRSKYFAERLDRLAGRPTSFDTMLTRRWSFVSKSVELSRTYLQIKIATWVFKSNSGEWKHKNQVQQGDIGLHVCVAEPTFLGTLIKIKCLLGSLGTSLIIFQGIECASTICCCNHMKYSIVPNDGAADLNRVSHQKSGGISVASVMSLTWCLLSLPLSHPFRSESFSTFHHSDTPFHP